MKKLICILLFAFAVFAVVSAYEFRSMNGDVIFNDVKEVWVAPVNTAWQPTELFTGKEVAIMYFILRENDKYAITYSNQFITNAPIKKKVFTKQDKEKYHLN
ncbi:MAG: hypothetical protein IKZ86_01185 [Spirochaetaceae bacterium]|nr:hypothetical protein [Spirochaetaceae bacterium]